MDKIKREWSQKDLNGGILVPKFSICKKEKVEVRGVQVKVV